MSIGSVDDLFAIIIIFLQRPTLLTFKGQAQNLTSFRGHVTHVGYAACLLTFLNHTTRLVHFQVSGFMVGILDFW